MYVAVFPASEMLGVLVHSDLRTAEDGRFVHVVPRVQIERASGVIVQLELLRPKLANGGISEVEPARRSCVSRSRHVTLA